MILTNGWCKYIGLELESLKVGEKGGKGGIGYAISLLANTSAA